MQRGPAGVILQLIPWSIGEPEPAGSASQMHTSDDHDLKTKAKKNHMLGWPKQNKAYRQLKYECVYWHVEGLFGLARDPRSPRVVFFPILQLWKHYNRLIVQQNKPQRVYHPSVFSFTDAALTLLWTPPLRQHLHTVQPLPQLTALGTESAIFFQIHLFICFQESVWREGRVGEDCLSESSFAPFISWRWGPLWY